MRPYRVYEVTGTNVKVKLVSTPDIKPHYSKFQSVRTTFQQTSFGMVTSFLDLESRGQSESETLGRQQLQLLTVVT